MALRDTGSPAKKPRSVLSLGAFDIPRPALANHASRLGSSVTRTRTAGLLHTAARCVAGALFLLMQRDADLSHGRMLGVPASGGGGGIRGTPGSGRSPLSRKTAVCKRCRRQYFVARTYCSPTKDFPSLLTLIVKICPNTSLSSWFRASSIPSQDYSFAIYLEAARVHESAARRHYTAIRNHHHFLFVSNQTL